MSGCILLADQRGVEEGRSRNRIADKAQDVNGRKVNGETMRRFTPPVEDWLRVEGCRPGEGAALQSVVFSALGKP